MCGFDNQMLKGLGLFYEGLMNNTTKVEINNEIEELNHLLKELGE